MYLGHTYRVEFCILSLVLYLKKLSFHIFDCLPEVSGSMDLRGYMLKSFAIRAFEECLSRPPPEVAISSLNFLKNLIVFSLRPKEAPGQMKLIEHGGCRLKPRHSILKVRIALFIISNLEKLNSHDSPLICFGHLIVHGGKELIQ